MPPDNRTSPLPFLRASVSELQELADLYERVDPLVEIFFDPLHGEARVARRCERCRAFHPLPEN